MRRVKFVVKRPRRTLPDALICNQAEAIELLRRKVFDDAVKVGWLKPCVADPKRSRNATKLFAVSAVQNVARRILEGEYPTPA